AVGHFDFPRAIAVQLRVHERVARLVGDGVTIARGAAGVEIPAVRFAVATVAEDGAAVGEEIGRHRCAGGLEVDADRRVVSTATAAAAAASSSATATSFIRL